ncbi:uncharacterized protein LOC117122025 [Anneissia japonica]|uniref:uncharacterized protein LOC117122025 n=1 Tax=Anneissia japonica TaxID=1529436 RepID=UPI0014256813|nr:uncharacterized protein LOC117122025 [Anneissia japonica]XP_033123403.1 uncharacterized protein LOC117122025 [Anneissia japonica]XP_033123404.1 uncharacterized protein LOC117122025 [Anneissia japonica]XP_033123405.1 uncharacterized protein LOC117122025 [Anneissia japonica]XP_033123406.1 uncharacterized protein LOC117122025 [Anneissia japonica]
MADMNNALKITSTRKDRKYRRNMTEPSVLPSIHHTELKTGAVYLNKLLDKDREHSEHGLPVAKSLELPSRSLPAISDMQHVTAYDLPQFPKRTFPIPRKNCKLAPLSRKRSDSLNSNDGRSINVLESRSIVLSKRREDGKRLLEPIGKDKMDEFRRWHFSLQLDDNFDKSAPPKTSNVTNQDNKMLNQEASKSELNNTKLSSSPNNREDYHDKRLVHSAHDQNRTDNLNYEVKNKSYIVYTMTTPERKRIEDWLEDCLNSRNDSGNHSDDEFIEVVNQTNVASDCTKGNGLDTNLKDDESCIQ